MKPRIPLLLLSIVIAQPAQGQTPPRAGGKKMVITGLALTGVGIGAAAYGHSADRRTVTTTTYSTCVGAPVTCLSAAPTGAVALAILPGSSSATSTLVSVTTEIRGPRWSILGPAIGSITGGTIMALMGKQRMKIAANDHVWRVAVSGKGATATYTW